MPKFSQELDTPLYKGPISFNTGMFVDNEWRQPTDGATIDVMNPTTGKLITKIPSCGPKDVDVAVQAAKKAFYSSWGPRVGGSDRGRLLNKFADLLEKHIDELAAIEAMDCGKFFPHAKMMDLTQGIATIRFYAGWADKNYGRTIETDENKFVYTIHEPIGVVGAIVPWNFPFMITMWKLGPALATGNCIILKPSEVTPLSSLKIAELVKEAGFPPGVVNVVPGFGSVAGQAITEHRDIYKVSFTGSTVTGRKIMDAAGKSNLKRVTLELGGKSPNIVFDDADLEQAIKWTAAGIFHHSGQMCSASSRIFVQSGIYDAFVSGMTQAAQSAKGGSSFDPTTTSGPVVSQNQFDRVMNYIDSGKEAGASIVTGGQRLGREGYYIQPTIFANVKPDMKIVREEIFGPVGVLVKFDTEEEVLKMSNDTTYGLAASVFTRDVTRATTLASKLEAGSVYINMSAIPDQRVEFGGFKMSGFGKDMGAHALESYTQIKAVQVNVGIKL